MASGCGLPTATVMISLRWAAAGEACMEGGEEEGRGSVVKRHPPCADGRAPNTRRRRSLRRSSSRPCARSLGPLQPRTSSTGRQVHTASLFFYGRATGTQPSSSCTVCLACETVRRLHESSGGCMRVPWASELAVWLLQDQACPRRGQARSCGASCGRSPAMRRTR